MEIEMVAYAMSLVFLGVTALYALLRVYDLEDKLAKTKGALDDLRWKIRQSERRDRINKAYSCADCYRTGQHRKIISGQEGDR